MRPIPIDADDFAKIVQREIAATGHERIVFSAPNGDLLDDNVRPVEAVAWEGSELGVTSYSMVILLEELDLVNLHLNGGKLLITMVGGVAPYDVEVL